MFSLQAALDILFSRWEACYRRGWLVSRSNFSIVHFDFGIKCTQFYCILLDPLGRRLSMILVNIPYLIGWFTLSQATSVPEVFIGFVMLGLAVGLMEAPTVTYLGEIWYANRILNAIFLLLLVCIEIRSYLQ